MRKGRFAILAVLLIAAAARLSLPLFGTSLVVADALQPADAIVILSSNGMDRAYEGGVLYRERLAPLVLISHPDESSLRTSAAQVGVMVPTPYDLQRSALLQMGVPVAAIRDLPGEPHSTEDEAALIRRAAADLHLRSVIVTTSPYHSRRARLYLRSAAGGRFRVIMHPSRYDVINPKSWWRHSNDRIDVILEWLKLPKCLWSILF